MNMSIENIVWVNRLYLKEERSIITLLPVRHFKNSDFPASVEVPLLSIEKCPKPKL